MTNKILVSIALLITLLQSASCNQGPFSNYPPPPPNSAYTSQIYQPEETDPYNVGPNERRQAPPPNPFQQYGQGDPRLPPRPSQPGPPYSFDPNQNPYRRVPVSPQYNAQPSTPPQQQQETGFFAKLKNTITAAGNAVMSSLEPSPSQSDYYPPPPAQQQGPPGYPAYSTPQYPPPPPPPQMQRQGPPQDPRIGQQQFPRHTQTHPQHLQHPSVPQRGYAPGGVGGEEGISGKLKSLLGLEESSEDNGSASQGFFPPPARAISPSSSPNSNINNDWSSSAQHPSNPSEASSSSSSSSSSPSSSFISDARYGLGGVSSGYQTQSQPQQQLVSADPFEHLPSDPQVFIHEDSIVMVMKPKELAKKKAEMKLAGGQAIQFFTDFEHVLTRFKHEEGGDTLGSRELVEFAGILSPECVQALNQLSEEFNAVDVVEDSHYEDIALRSQQAVVRQGNLHIAHVGPATRALLSKLGLRDGWKEALQGLSLRGVPSFVFSSGYGDVVANALLLGGVAQSSSGDNLNANAHALPQNLRIVSNFFRAAPDGTVRAFSQPVVHDRNKNVTTAERHMGMAVPNRPYAIVLGSEEEDVRLTEGLQGLKQQISIGFLELSEDFAQRLPVFLSTYDAVIIGEGNLKYVQHMLEEVLQLPPSQTQTQGNANGNNNSNGQRRLGLAFGGITKIFMNNPQNQQTTSEQSQSSPPPPPPPPPLTTTSTTPPHFYPQQHQQQQHHQQYPPQQQQQQQPPHPQYQQAGRYPSPPDFLQQQQSYQP